MTRLDFEMRLLGRYLLDLAQTMHDRGEQLGRPGVKATRHRIVGELRGALSAFRVACKDLDGFEAMGEQAWEAEVGLRVLARPLPGRRVKRTRGLAVIDTPAPALSAPRASLHIVRGSASAPTTEGNHAA